MSRSFGVGGWIVRRIILALLASLLWAWCCPFPVRGADVLSPEKAAAAIAEIVAANTAMLGGLKAIEYRATRNSTLQPERYEGITRQTASVTFIESGAKFAMDYRLKSEPLGKVSLHTKTCYDEAQWSHLDDSEKPTLYVSRKSLPLRSGAPVGSNVIFAPYSQLMFGGARENVFRLDRIKDYADSRTWNEAFKRVMAISAIHDEEAGPGFEISTKFPDHLTGEWTWRLTTRFLACNGFVPSSWRIHDGSGALAEDYVVRKFRTFPIPGSDRLVRLPEEALANSYEEGEVVATTETVVEVLVVNEEPDASVFTIDPARAESIYDLDDEVHIPIPR